MVGFGIENLILNSPLPLRLWQSEIDDPSINCTALPAAAAYTTAAYTAPVLPLPPPPRSHQAVAAAAKLAAASEVLPVRFRRPRLCITVFSNINFTP